MKSEHLHLVMSKLYDPDQRRPPWAAKPIPCTDCGALLANDWFRSGPKASVCRRCQNKRYESKARGTPEGQRRQRRKTLLAKLKRIEDRMTRDRKTHQEVLNELNSLSAS